MEECDGEQMQMHPNWVALATVKFRPKIFVKSSGTEEDEDKTIIDNSTTKTETDESAKAYEEIIQQPSTATQQKLGVKRKSPRKKRKIEKVEFDREVLFRLAMQDDGDGIRQMMMNSIGANINSIDSYGWTGLMMAACERSASSFETLLNMGADLSISDKKGNTATSIAQKKGFEEILGIIERHSEFIEISDDDETEVETGTQFCSDCGIEISRSSSKSHQTSTVHLFSCKFKGNDNIKAFGIARSNLGFQMMRRNGWNGNSGLGAKQNGKLYPIRTVIRKRNTGLGIEQDSAKVTHFKANDTSAVHFRPPPRALTRREIHENDLKDKRHEQRLRRELT
jgi:G-patch domain